jgi:type IV pilus assembly protein PilC
MPIFIWKGRTPTGGLTSGELTADNQAKVIEGLRKRNIIVTSVKEKPREIKLPFLGGGKVRVKDLAIFTRQFSTMISAGLPLMQCLDIQSQQIEKEGFRKIVKAVMTDIEGGSTLADALRRHPATFSALYTNMVDAGEKGGILDNILARLATYLEKNEALNRKIKGAMIYPAIVVTVAVLAAVILMVFVIPVFAAMFKEMNAALPLPTRITIAVSDVLKSSILIIAAVVVAIVILIRFYYKTDNGQKVIDTFLLKVWIFGPLIQKSSISRFARTLGTLLASGVAILDALEITAKTSGNRVVQDAVMEARKSIGGGETISGPLRTMKVFPPMVTSMIAVGEATGGLDEMLTKIADFYDSEVDAAVENLTAALEPVIIVFLGVFIGGLVISMYLPIFTMASVIK